MTVKGSAAYERIRKDLRRSYGPTVQQREDQPVEPWKAGERSSFLDQMHREGKSTLLEIGAGVGVHGKFFQDGGLQVVSTDLSPTMVEACRSKGLEAYEMDFLRLAFEDGSFDGIWALNCLLHVPPGDLDAVLREIERLLAADGLFYWGQHGGVDQAQVYEDDHQVPQRFFSFLYRNRSFP